MKQLPKVGVALPGTLGIDDFEAAIRPTEEARSKVSAFTFDLNGLVFAPLDVLISLLFLLNELATDGHSVNVEWDARQSGALGYAERMGFFELLSTEVAVVPERPSGSTYETYRDSNPLILEMTGVPPGAQGAEAEEALNRLDERLRVNLVGTASEETLDDLWTFAAETLGNIFEHSGAATPGVVAAQRYASPKRGPRISIVIADAGLGIPKTIRDGNPAAAKMNDKDIILTAFRDGLSRRAEKGRGCGLTQCARVAMKHQANLRVRVGRVWAKLVTRSEKAGITIGFFEDEAATISGTQIALDLYLDRLRRAV